VGSLRPNDWGLFDLHGNAWEWCHDRDDKAAGDSAVDTKDKEDILDNYRRLLRGGSFRHGVLNARSAARFSDAPANRMDDRGFRPAMTFR
jgi:formylglycine-generating enzyme required for sulfatase activity